MYNLHPCDQINFWIPVVTSMGVGVDNGWWNDRVSPFGVKTQLQTMGFVVGFFHFTISWIVMHPLYGIVAK